MSLNPFFGEYSTSSQNRPLPVLSPIFVPGVLFGVAVLFLYAQLRLNNTLFGLVLAHSAAALPFVTVLMEAGIAQLDRSLVHGDRSYARAAARAAVRLLQSRNHTGEDR